MKNLPSCSLDTPAYGNFFWSHSLANQRTVDLQRPTISTALPSLRTKSLITTCSYQICPTQQSKKCNTLTGIYSLQEKEQKNTSHLENQKKLLQNDCKKLGRETHRYPCFEERTL